MIRSRLVGFALVEQNIIDLLGGRHFCLAFLLVEDGVVQRLAFVEDGNYP
jgi:hypothetical protein